MSRRHTCAESLDRISSLDLKPTRSTAPLLAWWADREKALAATAKGLGVPSLGDSTICYEHPTVVGGTGRGKASMTDILVRYPGGAVAIEGKWTEPRYPTVRDWRGSMNKKVVLSHWLGLIRPFCCGPLQEQPDVNNIVYQMLHRIASACHAADGGQATVIYQVFESIDHRHGDEYAADLQLASKILGPEPRLRLALMRVPLEVTDAWKEMAELMGDKGKAALVASQARRRISEIGALFKFEPARVQMVGDRDDLTTLRVTPPI